MKNDHEHIEEKLIPYLEGVLNAKERREIDEAINSDGNLAREMSEMREIILELRNGFANGMKPPQEEVSVDEVVELGFHTGPGDKMPGTSQQKARLFCSDSALEEYSMLRALQEEIARTELDRENVPEMPAALLQEFRGLKPVAGSRKVLAFDRSRLSPMPLWKRASSMLDRIDPKPLMASAASLVMLSLGVHLYNRPAAAPTSSQGGAEIGYNFNDEAKPTAAATPVASGTPGAVAKDPNGVAVFTSDDRGLLKEQAEKLLANKLRYTVTKDRILVAEKDVKEARGILWADAEGKAVAMGKTEEPAASKRMATVGGGGSASGGASPAVAGEAVGAAVPDTSQAPPQVIDVDRELAEPSNEPAPVQYYRTEPPAKPAAPTPPRPPRGETVASSSRPSSPSSGARSALQAKSNERVPLTGGVRSTSAITTETPKPPLPTEIQPGMASDDVLRAPEPTVVKATTTEGRAPMSDERRNRLREMAVGDGGEAEAPVDKGADRDDAAPPPPRPVAPVTAPAPVAQAQTTTTINRARVAAGPPAARAENAPVANVVTADSAARVEDEESADSVKQKQADSRLARMETNRQTVAQRNGVELSFESKDGKVSVYVRPKKALNKAELDALRKALRKELGLSDSDTLIFR